MTVFRDYFSRLVQMLPSQQARTGSILALLRTIVATGTLWGLMTQGTASAQQLAQAVRGNWLRCNIVDGRVTFDATRLGAMTSTTRRGAGGKETLNVRNENGQSSLNYDRTTDEDQLAIEIADSGDRVLIRRTPRGSSSVVSVEFKQTADEKSILTLGSGADKRVFRARGIWQLLIAQPEACRRHLLPLLEMLRPDWKLADAAAHIEERLLQEVGSDEAAKRANWAALAAQLADEDFAKRQAADRALRAGGPGAIAYLRQLDFNRLEAEQQCRIQRILDAQSEQQDDDSVEQAAASLAVDPAVWIALLERPDPTIRKTAARRLASLLGEPIGVDPTADPNSQKEKRDQLRARIEEK